MYCSLEDAFPENCRQGVKKPEKVFSSSCWHNDVPIASPLKEAAPAPVVVGANVQEKQTAPLGPTTAISVPYAQTSPSGPFKEKAECFSALHHCLSCATCQQIIHLHFQNSLLSATTGGHLAPLGVGAQVGLAESTPSRRKKSSHRRPLMGANVTNILNTPISPNSNITWGHILILLVGGAFLILVVDRLKK